MFKGELFVFSWDYEEKPELMPFSVYFLFCKGREFKKCSNWSFEKLHTALFIYLFLIQIQFIVPQKYFCDNFKFSYKAFIWYFWMPILFKENFTFF